MSEPNPDSAFSVQTDVRSPWRSYLDLLIPFRPALFDHCRRLTGNIWDAEDLVQDTLIKVFAALGKTDAELANPQAYLIRAATNLWIDQARRTAREIGIDSGTAEDASDDRARSELHAHAAEAAGDLLGRLPPQERAVMVLKDVLDYSLSETADLLSTSVGAVKSALHRAREKLANPPSNSPGTGPSKAIVEQFMQALSETDLDTLRSICAADLTVELVGGAVSHTFEDSQNFFAHAHFVMPEIGFGEHPHWRYVEYEGEPMVVGLRTLDGVEGINEVHRLQVSNGKITAVRCYCFCPDTLSAFGEAIGEPSLARPYRSPDFNG